MPRPKRVPKSLVVLTDDAGNITNVMCAETEVEQVPKPRKGKVVKPPTPKKPAPTIRIEHGDFKISFS